MADYAISPGVLKDAVASALGDLAGDVAVARGEVTVTVAASGYLTAMKRLRENGYLTMDADNLITLTPAGMEIARSIYDRHKTLSSFLESLGVDSDVAREDACKIEHDISEESFTAIRKLMQVREQHPENPQE